jgi:hypothetical protein
MPRLRQPLTSVPTWVNPWAFHVAANESRLRLVPATGCKSQMIMADAP